MSAGFPGSSAGKESACNAGDPGLIPGSRRSTGEGIVSPLQSSWASLVAQLVKNPPAMREIWVSSLGWKTPWRRERPPTPGFWPGEFMEAGVAESDLNFGNVTWGALRRWSEGGSVEAPASTGTPPATVPSSGPARAAPAGRKGALGTLRPGPWVESIGEGRGWVS